ncbi:MAG: extracellular solute-binding protein [Planctomycetes bacterium]|nr:extracellular solute-binding protein [Planctomycetota bacterium]
MPAAMTLALLLSVLVGMGASGASNGRELVVMAEEGHLTAWLEIEALSRAFEHEHPGLSVRCLPLGGAAGSQDKPKFLIAGGVPLDLLRIDVTELAAYAGEGALVDLAPYFAADPSWDERAYFPAVLGALHGPRGELWGLPSTFTPYVMYVNLDRLSELGLARPASDWTWHDFRALARRATTDDDGDGRTDRYGVSLTQWLQAVCPWIWQAGGELIDSKGERARMGEPEFVESMRFLHALLHEDKVASFDASFANQLTQGLFQGGKALFYGPVGYWETYRFRSIERFRWDVVQLPRGKRAATSVAMTVYVVPRTAREPELAYEFLRRLAGPEYQRMLARIGNGVPGLIAAAESADFLKPEVAPESEQVFLDVLREARLQPPVANWRKIESLVQAELEGILLQPDCDVPAACARMAAKTDEYLARERERGGRARLPRGALELAVGGALLGLLALFLVKRGARPAARERRRERAALALLVPWASGFVLFLLGPALVALVLALCEWSPLRPLDDVRWAGLDNLARLGGDATFASSLGATALYAALCVPLGLALAFGLALLLRRESRATSLVRTACYLPAIVAPVIVAALWRLALDAEHGPVNECLRALGLGAPAWLRDPAWVVPSFVLVSLWSVGAQMLVFVAALQALDPALEEAARVDGAGPLARHWHVVLPQLGPVLLFNLLTGLVAAAQIFAQPYVMTQGGPGDASRFLVLYVYESAFQHFDVGYACALAWVLFAALAAACGLLFVGTRRFVHYRGRSA